MATTHATSVFANSCLAIPRDPVTKLPSDRLEQFKSGSERAPESTASINSPSTVTRSMHVVQAEISRPSTTGSLRSFRGSVGLGSERGGTLQTSLCRDTPYNIRPAAVSSRPRQSYAQNLSVSLDGGIQEKMSSHSRTDPSAVVGNERQSDERSRDESYAELFATLLESNALLREEIQKLKEDNQKTMARVEQLHTPLKERMQDTTLNLVNGRKSTAPGHEVHTHVHVPSGQNVDEYVSSDDSDEQLSQGLPPKLLENTWVESSEGKCQQPSCMSSLLSQHSLPTSVHVDDQHECDPHVVVGHNGSGKEGSTVTVEEVDEGDIHSDSSSSRLFSPSALPESHAHPSHSTESLLMDDSMMTSSSSDSGTRASRANEGDPFASPGLLAVEQMWSDFSVEDYAPPESFREEERKREKSGRKEWTPKITVPRPFSMSVRESNSPKRISRSMIQAEQERLEREALEEAELKKQFRAIPLPASTYLPLYELINAKNEQRREEVKMMSKEILKATERPFSFVKRENEKRLMKEDEMRRSLLLENLKQKESMFRANPFPKHLFDPDVDERLKEQEEYREIRIKLRAQELLASSKLPENMQGKGREYSIGALRKKRLKENETKAFMTDEHKFHPCISNGVPDYYHAYMEFQKQLALRKKTKHATATEPFYLRTGLIPSRRQQVIQDIENDETLKTENRWPFKVPGVKVSNKSPTHRRSKSSSVPYPSQLTKTAKVRFSLTQEKLISEVEKERAKEKEQRERKERQDTLKKSVAQKTLPYDPTAWLEERKQKKYKHFQ